RASPRRRRAAPRGAHDHPRPGAGAGGGGVRRARTTRRAPDRRGGSHRPDRARGGHDGHRSRGGGCAGARRPQAAPAGQRLRGRAAECRALRAHRARRRMRMGAHVRLTEPGAEVDALERALARAADGAFVTGDDGCIRSWNRAAEKLLGYASHEVLGRACRDLFDGYDADGNRHFDMRARTKAGRPIWLTMSVLTTPGGAQERRTVHLFRAVTARARRAATDDAGPQHGRHRRVPTPEPGHRSQSRPEHPRQARRAQPPRGGGVRHAVPALLTGAPAGQIVSFQSAVKTSRPRGEIAPRLPQNTRRLPSRVNMGKDAKPSAHVTRSRPEPSRLTRYSANERPEGSCRLDAKMIWRPFGCRNGAKFAPASRVTRV